MSEQRAALLLADRSASLRLLVLRDLLGRAEDDPEVLELEALRMHDPLVSSLSNSQTEDGAWTAEGRSGIKGALQSTAQALIRLGALGFGANHDVVKVGAEFLFSHQKDDGSWPLASDLEPGEQYSNYDMIPLQTAMPLRGLAATGFATDSRAERAFEWLLEQRLEDGTWPTGTASGVLGRVAGYRRLPHSRWGCRSNTTGALLCFAFHPQKRLSEEAQRAMDHLLARETRERRDFGFEVARTLGVERAGGLFTYFARFDMALMLDLAWRVGVSLADERVADLVEHIRSLQGPYGLWEYVSKPQISRWLTFDLLRSLSRLGVENGWLSIEPRTDFRPYLRRQARY
jgi:hypothetical protein